MTELLAATSWNPRYLGCGLGLDGGMIDLVAPVSTRKVSLDEGSWNRKLVVEGAATTVSGRSWRFLARCIPLGSCRQRFRKWCDTSTPEEDSGWTWAGTGAEGAGTVAVGAGTVAAGAGIVAAGAGTGAGGTGTSGLLPASPRRRFPVSEKHWPCCLRHCCMRL